MSVREAARELSRAMAATESDIGVLAVYRKADSVTVTPESGTITSNFTDVWARCYRNEMTIREQRAGAGVVERADLVLHFVETAITPRSEEDQVWADIYRLGTISVNRNATIITGASVNWSDIEPGDYLRLSAQGTFHRAASIVNAASRLRLSEAYANATLSGATYRIFRPYQVISWWRSGDQAEWEIHGRRIS